MTSRPCDQPSGLTGNDAPYPALADTERPLPLQRTVLWLAGFALLFAVNALVELLILPQLGFEDTPDNDVYFQSWWVLLGLWFVFGNSILTKIDTERESCGSADRRVDSPACAEPDQL